VRVVQGQERPPMAKEWSVSLQLVMRGGWQREPWRRPTAAAAFDMLRQEIQDMVARDFPVQAARTEEQRQRQLLTSGGGATTTTTTTANAASALGAAPPRW